MAQAQCGVGWAQLASGQRGMATHSVHTTSITNFCLFAAVQRASEHKLVIFHASHIFQQGRGKQKKNVFVYVLSGSFC